MKDNHPKGNNGPRGGFSRFSDVQALMDGMQFPIERFEGILPAGSREAFPKIFDFFSDKRQDFVLEFVFHRVAHGAQIRDDGIQLLLEFGDLLVGGKALQFV
jgi:hypothetical protein